MSAPEFAAWSGGALALIGILAALTRFVRTLHGAANRLERIEKLSRELAPNTGGSIKDTVNRLETKIDRRLDLLAADLSALSSKVDDRLEDYGTRLARAEGRIEAIAMVTSPTMLIEDDEGRIRDARNHPRQ